MGKIPRTTVKARQILNYWLMKSEPSEVSIDDLNNLPNKQIGWFGVRNYQARNFMLNQMQVGDLEFFYHSSCPVPGIAGTVRVVTEGYPDPTQFDPESTYFDPKATKNKPRWFQVTVELIQKTRFVSLAELRAHPALISLRILHRGNRLSITPVTPDEWEIVATLT